MSRPFSNRFSTPRLSAEEAARQGRASRLAFEILGAADAIAFLNAPNEAIGGRPIDLAVQSIEGLAAVEDALAARRAA